MDVKRAKPPLFSIVVVHYQGTIPHAIYQRGIRSLLEQTFRDFEILCYHDGPLLEPNLEFLVPIRATSARFNNYGHSLRDIGIHEASGEYILHFNADNVLYSDALEAIAKEISRESVLLDENTNLPLATNDMILFPIVLADRVAFRSNLFRKPGLGLYVILTGHPPKLGNIDCMQLVMKRELWLKEGGWRDKTRNGDGIMYEKFCRRYGYRSVGAVLGEHH